MQEDLSRYPVEIERAKAVDVRMRRRCFEIELEGGDVQNSASLIAASGVEDLLPPIRGIEQFWGISVHNCMYCDGWEVRDRRLGVLGSGESGVELSSLLARWSSDLTLFLDDPSDLTADQRARLSDSRVKVEARKIIALVGDPGNPTISLEDGTELRVDGLFIRPPIRPRLEFLRNLLPVDDLGYAEVDRYGRTCVRRLYIAGDASGQLFQAIGAAADGNKVARWLVHDLMTSH